MGQRRGSCWAGILTLAFAPAWIGGCNPDDGINPVTEGDADDSTDDSPGWIDQSQPPAPWNELTWTESIAEVGGQDLKAGYQGDLVAASDGTLYYVYWKFQGDGGSCDIAAFGGGPAPNLQYFLKVAVKAPSATQWTVETVPLQDVTGSLDAVVAGQPASGPRGYGVTLSGIDAEIDPSDNLVIAVAAGGTALYTCGSSELVLATRTGPSSYDVEAVVNSSADFARVREGVPPPDDVDLECCGDTNCNAGAGDTAGDIGAWAALAISSSGRRAVAYSDHHNLGTEDGNTKQGLEYWDDGAISGIRPYSGVGQYADLIWAGSTPIVAYTGYKQNGLHVLRRVSTANSCSDQSNDWEEADLGSSSFSQFKIGERIRFAQASGGTIGMVFHVQEDNTGAVVNDLYLCETVDQGANWVCAPIDAKLMHLGGYPSLAYDEDDNPMVAYQYCGSAECPMTSDGVRIAIRLADRWYRSTVHSLRTSSSGFYTSLAFNPVTNEPTVVFQDLTYGAAIAYHGHLP